MSFLQTLPIAASDIAVKWDTLYFFLFWLSVFFFILVIGGMIYFAIRYRHQKNKTPTFIAESHTLEIIWSVIPTALLMVIFAWGYIVYREMVQAPPDAFEIRVIAKQWLWQFQYEDGRMTVGEVFVPVNKAVKFIMSSEDVLHSFFVPNFRVKQDVVPGMYTNVWFEPTVPGRHQIYCAEYCGTSHSQMLADLYVLTAEQWDAWKLGKKMTHLPEADPAVQRAPVLSDSPMSGSLAEWGKKLLTQKGCVACHSDDGIKKVGPSHKGLYNSKVELADGQTVVADENYLRESIENPQAKLVKGYGPLMPTFKGLINEEEMNAMLAYIKSLR